MTTVVNDWREKVGNQRDWIWRGWKIRYTYLRSREGNNHKPPLIFLHGFGGSIGQWRYNLEALSQHYTIYAMDMLGFGATEKAPVRYNVKIWVEQVYDFWRTLINRPVVLIGHSTGSLISLAAAQNHPEMVSGIVMMSIADPSIEREAIPPILQPIVASIKSVVASPVLLKPLFYFLRQPSVLRRWAGLAYANPKAVTDELVDILAAPPRDRGSARVFSQLFRGTIRTDFGPSVKKVLPTLSIPMLLIWGNQDRFIPPTFAKEFASYNQNVQLIQLDNAGHCPYDECYEQVNPVILDWMDKFID
ncbi:MAG: alpha/beta fold hydrolase [Cyanobacteria bacterium P01_A01_bin.84]